MSNLIEVSDPQSREAFRAFAMIYPHEAAAANWTEFFALAREIIPDVTEAEVRETLKET
jgi:hypothetical protein